MLIMLLAPSSVRVSPPPLAESRSSPLTIKTSISVKQLFTETASLESPRPQGFRKTVSLGVIDESLELRSHLSVSSPSCELMPKPLHPEFGILKTDTRGYYEHFNRSKVPPDILEKAASIGANILKSQEFLDKEISSIAVPTLESMLLIASYYEKKYGTPIFVCRSQVGFQSLITGLSIDSSIKSWGVIATWGDDRILHVTPYLCHRKNTATLQILDLDAASNPIPYAKFSLLELKGSLKSLEIYQVESTRQADGFSCRTDALVILKEALCDIKNRLVLDLAEYLPVKHSSYKTLSVDNFFDLPHGWSKGAQIRQSSEIDATLRLPSKPSITLQEHRQKYSIYSKKQVSYQLITPSTTETHSFTEDATISTYLNTKGKKLCALAERLKADGDFEIALRFGFIKDLFL